MTKNTKIYAVIAVVAVLGAGYGVYHLLGNKAPRGAETTDTASITNFDQCVEAGFAIIKHYPDQCKTPDDRIFVNQNPPAESECLTSKVTAFNGPLTSYFSNIFCILSHFRRGTIMVINLGS